MDSELNDKALVVLRAFGYQMATLDDMSAAEIEQLAACHSITKTSDTKGTDDEYAIDRPAAIAVMNEFLERMKATVSEDTGENEHEVS